MVFDAELENLRVNQNKADETLKKAIIRHDTALKSRSEARLARKTAAEWLDLRTYATELADGKLNSARRKRNKRSKELNAREAKSPRGLNARSKAELDALREEVDLAYANYRAEKLKCKPFEEVFEIAKSSLVRAEAEFIDAKAALDQAVDSYKSVAKAFKQRLDSLSSSSKEYRDEKWRLAEVAFVPLHYRHKVYVVREANGTNLYFGGVNVRSDNIFGDDHGHFVLNPSEKLVYARLPGEAHGSHNFDEAHIERVIHQLQYA